MRRLWVVVVAVVAIGVLTAPAGAAKKPTSPPKGCAAALAAADKFEGLLNELGANAASAVAAAVKLDAGGIAAASAALDPITARIRSTESEYDGAAVRCRAGK